MKHEDLDYNEKHTENVDGMFFSLDDDDQWSLTFIQFNETYDFEQNDLGLKYSIMIFDEKNDNNYVLFDAFLLDAKIYIKELLNAHQQGLVIKKCSLAENIINDIIHLNNMRNLEHVVEKA